MQILELYKRDIYHGSLILVNERYHYKENYSSAQRVKYLHHLMHYDVSRMLQHLFEKNNFYQDITIVSAYRSSQEQKEIYEESLREHGEEYTKSFVAMPHCSEHETGLAIDFALRQKNIDFICPDFPYEGVCQQLRELSYQYGFIERYAKNKQDITHIAREPWHFRYVGFPHSLIMKEKDLCLEEYHDFIRQYSLFNPYVYIVNQKIIEIFYIPLQHEKTTICLKDDIVYQVSGNNIDGVIVTAWRTCL